jgi:hypothetical protein
VGVLCLHVHTPKSFCTGEKSAVPASRTTLATKAPLVNGGRLAAAWMFSTSP